MIKPAYPALLSVFVVTDACGIGSIVSDLGWIWIGSGLDLAQIHIGSVLEPGVTEAARFGFSR